MTARGDRLEIPARTNANEAEKVIESKQLVAKTMQRETKTDLKSRARNAAAIKKHTPQKRGGR